MKIKIHSNELNRMMKTISACINQKDSKYGNIEIVHDNNLLTIRGTDGFFQAELSAPMLGSDGERFCIDGGMFAKVIGMCNGEVEISTTEKVCTIKGVGRTRIPIMDVDIPAFDDVSGTELRISAEDFQKSYGHVAYAVSTNFDQSRIQLTGVLLESSGAMANMTALDGFQMSVEHFPYEGGEVKIVVPGAFMNLISKGVCLGETITMTTDGKRMKVQTDGMTLQCGLLAGNFPDTKRIVPESFATMCRISADALRDALKAGNVVNNKQSLVKLEIVADSVTVRNNSEQADYDAEIPCETNGKDLVIAFNDRYLLNALSAIDGDEAVLNFNNSVNPLVVTENDKDCIRLCLPVRVMG